MRKPGLSFVICALVPVLTWFCATAPAAVAAVGNPVLKWKHGGCYSSWCETGWYSSPAVADLDGDGKMEVLGAAYSLFVLNGEDGSQKFSVTAGSGGRVWPGVVVADIDRDGKPEIVLAQGGGYVTVLDHAGKTVWSRQPTTSELRGLSAYDLDRDGFLEIVVTGAVGSKTNTWVYNHNGRLLDGWPQLANDNGYAWGVYNSNAAVYDLDKDGQGEIVVPSDVHYICAYNANGSHIPANNTMYEGKRWGQVGVWESLGVEKRGWGTCEQGDPRSERHRPNFAHGAATIADVNGDSNLEVVVAGNVYDCATENYDSRYNGIYIFNRDRTRFNRDGFDWRKVPLDTGAPLSEDYEVIENCQPNPVVVDLDGDGRKEIVYSSYDGRVHAFWLDKKEHGNWPFSVYDSGEGIMRFASEPVVADLDNDGCAEVIFTSWVEKSAHRTGKLHILDCMGNPVRQVSLPAAYGSPDWNGALAAPTLANIDDDQALEVVINTAHSGLVAYDLPGTANARILWGTGRGNYQRTGTADPSPLPIVTVTATKTQVPESGASGTAFRIRRTGGSASAITVKYTLSGTARNGIDYAKLSGTRTLPAGVSSALVKLTPVDDSRDEKNERVIMRISPDSSYIVRTPATAEIIIVDND
ncbi:FG-GAP-like repeat-containing protein [Syntrophobacter fumaroxidans]|uniref:FG-GAP repeat protein n=1 Tax=Syntrophobacter fumaroxidans (strain DSM 10017 / MPOB) TaxID=335543 RepID=A0LPJ5_SYNFM|nr:FG-GAP-like repeat-containing protein [Syntrophobacter fumaroxidans]ABK19347.1 FG-GAP repeat protein [Syntrophobacter fumaroxidans MPOB]